MKIAICANCLETYKATTYGHGLQIGGERGDQRDPTHDYIDVCGPCMTALTKADFATIHERYRETRAVTIGSNGPIEEVHP